MAKRRFYRRKKQIKPARLPRRPPKKIKVSRARPSTIIENPTMKPVQTFPRKRRDEYEVAGSFRISRRPSVLLTAPKRRGWATSRREIMLRFNVVMNMTTTDNFGNPVDVTFQKSFVIAMVNTSYVKSREQAKKIIRQVETRAKEEYPKADILGTYLVEIIVGKRTNNPNVFGDSTINSNSHPRKLFPKKNLKDIT